MLSSASIAELVSAVARGVSADSPLEPLVRDAALRVEKKDRSGIERIAVRLQEGMPLDQALADCVPRELVELLRSSGAPSMLASVLRSVESQKRLESRIEREWSRLWLRLSTAAALLATLSVLVLHVMGSGGETLPDTIRDAGTGELPDYATYFIRYPAWSFLFVVGIPFGLASTLLAIVHLPVLRFLALWIPVWGRVLKYRDLFLVCFHLSQQLRVGVPSVDALVRTSAVPRDGRWQNVLRRASSRVSDGSSLSEALRCEPLVPRVLAWSLLTAEDRGELPGVFDTFSDIYGRHADSAMQAVQDLLPILTVTLLGLLTVLWGAFLLAPINLAMLAMAGVSLSRTDPVEFILRSLSTPGSLTYIGLMMLCIFFFFLMLYAARKRLIFESIVEHLAGLAERGLPLSSAIDPMTEDHSGPLPSSLVLIRRQLEQGHPLSEAFHRARISVPPVVVNAIAVGEAGGNLAPALADVREAYRFQRRTLRPFAGLAFTYQLGLCVVILGVFVLPIWDKFEDMFNQMGLPLGSWGTHRDLILTILPWMLLAFLATAFVLLSGRIGPGRTWMPPRPGCLGLLILFFFWPRSLASLLKRLILRPMSRLEAFRQFSTSLALLLRAGSSLESALGVVRELSFDGGFRRKLRRLHRSVLEGRRLSDLLDQDRFYPRELAWIVRTGESSGALADALREASRFFETKLHYAAATAHRAALALLVVTNGAFVTAAAYLIFGPILQLMEIMADAASRF